MFKIFKRSINTSARVYDVFKWIQPSGYDSGIFVYNPIVKEKTPLILKNNNIATWYMCGPTVYDSAHIGHACTYVRFDIIRRIMTEFFDINVLLLMGITDIDDKIILRSNESGENWQKLTNHYENEFFTDMDSLNVLRPYMTCRVTNHVKDIVSFVEKILNNNGAYVAKDGSVYFDTLACKTYGKLDLPQMDEPEKHDYKKSSLDFALWKAAKPNEPFWESPWSKGRPGWHIECSAMASSVFGSNIDIHSGGIDLAFPHHENEEAQSCCYHGIDQWVNYWFHTGHLHKSNETKMSKSLNNTKSIPELLQDLTPNQFRMFCLLTHYRSNIEYSDKLIHHAKTILKKIEFFVTDCNYFVSTSSENGNINAPELLKTLQNTKNKVSDALKDDFHTPKVIQSILNLISVGNDMLHQKKTEISARNASSVAAVSNYLQTLMSKLGLSQTEALKQNSNLSDNIMDILINFRNEIRIKAMERDVKDVESLKACDDVRKKLSNCGIDIRDQKGKSSWTLRQ